MSVFVCWLLILALTAGSLVAVESTVMRRSLTCEEQLQAVGVDASVCEKIRSAVSSVRVAVVDIDANVRQCYQHISRVVLSTVHHVSTCLKLKTIPPPLKRCWRFDPKSFKQSSFREIRTFSPIDC